MKSFSCLALSTLILLFFFTVSALAGQRLRLSTTTSTENSGLLRAVLPAFEERCDCTVDVIAVGTGKALKVAENGDVDVTLVHARSLEDAFVEAGHGVNRRDVMYNDFVIVGPAADPAKLSGAQDLQDVMQRLAHGRARFVSRGDASGTHVMERSLWKEAGVKPAGRWYVEAGQGMGEVLTMANELQAYALTDRATYIAYQGRIDLSIVYQGDACLFNPYGIIAVNPLRHPHINYELAMAFIAYLTSPEGQQAIADFKMNGQQLFFLYE